MPAFNYYMPEKRLVKVNEPVDVIASFHDHNIKPLYFRTPDKDGELHSYKIDDILYTKTTKYCGIEAIVYRCKATCDDYQKEFNLQYNIEAHAWTMPQNIYKPV